MRKREVLINVQFSLGGWMMGGGQSERKAFIKEEESLWDMKLSGRSDLPETGSLLATQSCARITALRRVTFLKPPQI